MMWGKEGNAVVRCSPCSLAVSPLHMPLRVLLGKRELTPQINARYTEKRNAEDTHAAISAAWWGLVL